MAWITLEDGRHVNTDWFDRDRQIKYNTDQAKKLNSQKFKNGYGKTDVSEGRIEHGKPNSLMEHTKNGRLDMEREKLHQQIIDKHFAGKSPAKGQKTFYMTGGGSASGKGTFVKNPEDYMKQDENCVVVDSDAIKKMLPEWDDSNPDSAGYLHEESSALAKRIMALARENGYNHMLDGTGDGSLKSLMGKITAAKESGFRVEAAYATTNMDTALQRNYDRYIKTGRLVPYAMVRNTHVEVSKLFPQVANQFDHVSLYDTTGKTTLIAECSYGGQINVINQSAYNSFLDKANFTDNPYYFDDVVKERLKNG